MATEFLLEWSGLVVYVLRNTAAAELMMRSSKDETPSAGNGGFFPRNVKYHMNDIMINLLCSVLLLTIYPV